MTKFECHKLQEGYFSVQGYFEYPRKILCRFQFREIGSHDSIPMTQSKRPDAHQSATYVWTRWQYRPDAHQCLETLNCSSASAQTMWQYCPDAIQCSTSNMVSVSDTNMGRQLQPFGRCGVPVWTQSLIRHVMQKKFNCLDVRLYGPDAQILV
jgi:hypothetical protein